VRVRVSRRRRSALFYLCKSPSFIVFPVSSRYRGPNCGRVDFFIPLTDGAGPRNEERLYSRVQGCARLSSTRGREAEEPYRGFIIDCRSPDYRELEIQLHPERSGEIETIVAGLIRPLMCPTLRPHRNDSFNVHRPIEKEEAKLLMRLMASFLGIHRASYAECPIFVLDDALIRRKSSSCR